MADLPAYAILGRGHWAVKIRGILREERRPVLEIASCRREASESEESYTARLASSLAGSGAQIAWLCVPPGPHVGCMIRAAMDAHVHLIVEKPWLGSCEGIRTLAAAEGIVVGVHFEYCLLDEIEAWRERFRQVQGGARGLAFGGRFDISRPDHLGIPAMVNLGSHLFAIRRYAARESEIGEISCAYEVPDERRVWIGPETVDFTQNREPIIQRFIRKFEAAMEGGDFPFGLDFAAAVAEDLTRYPDPQRAVSRRP
jgi:predicted dehydrogenase